MPLDIRTYPCLSDNIGVIMRDGATGAVGLVDVPEETAAIAALDQAGWTPTHIFITHHHADHIDGVGGIRSRFDLEVIGYSEDAHRLPRLTQWVHEGDKVMLGETTFEVIETPGHTTSHIAFVTDGAAFVGDMLFSLGCGRLSEGTPHEMWTSLLKLRALPDDTKIYCGHEYTQSNARFALSIDPDNDALKARAAEVDDLRAKGAMTVPSMLGEEKAANPFLRADDPDLAHKIGMADADPEQVFARIRMMKDGFR